MASLIERDFAPAEKILGKNKRNPDRAIISNKKIFSSKKLSINKPFNF
jgi:hypothetical protein